MNSGKFGEDAVFDYLQNLGCDILERNYHSRYGEIDLIAKYGECIIFCEVKTRKSNIYGNPAEYVTKKKMEKIIKTAMVYLENKECEMRFDVAEVFLRGGKAEINYIENAFGGNYEIFTY